MKAMFEKERFSPLFQFAILLMAFGICAMIGIYAVQFTAAAYLHIPVNKVPAEVILEKDASLSRILQVVGAFFILALPALVLAAIVAKTKLLQYLGFNIAISGKQMFFVVLIFMCALFVGDILAMLTQLVPVPKTWETGFKQMEDAYDKAAAPLLSMKNGNDYILALIIVALLPAVFEEILFRGSLQKVMVQITRNAFAGIFITSIIFSIFHWSYYGFLTRLFLGLVLGYLYYYSKNIWLNITAHFLNNAFTITLMYSLVLKGQTVQDALKDSDVSPKMAVYNTLFVGLLCSAALYFLFKAFRAESERVLAVNNKSDTADENVENTTL